MGRSRMVFRTVAVAAGAVLYRGPPQGHGFGSPARIIGPDPGPRQTGGALGSLRSWDLDLLGRVGVTCRPGSAGAVAARRSGAMWARIASLAAPFVSLTPLPPTPTSRRGSEGKPCSDSMS